MSVVPPRPSILRRSVGEIALFVIGHSIHRTWDAARAHDRSRSTRLNVGQESASRKHTPSAAPHSNLIAAGQAAP